MRLLHKTYILEYKKHAPPLASVFHHRPPSSRNTLQQPHTMEQTKETTVIRYLPSEILLKFAEYLDNDALFEFALTSREFMSLCLDFDILDSESRNSYGQTMLIVAIEYHLYNVLEFRP